MQKNLIWADGTVAIFYIKGLTVYNLYYPSIEVGTEKNHTMARICIKIEMTKAGK